MADVDIQRMETLRAKEHSFSLEGPIPAYAIQYLMKETGDAAPTDFEAKLLRYVEPHPFVPQGDPEALGMRCREILAAHDGRIRAANNPGPGATFTFELPLAPAANPNPAARR